ncbi:hypothetical protein N836_28280 [Leptolyngbya sp. Heron Island J]|uniref:hypothetical protein n=1 Tax=Leptolyngbya sp. Heron Island J TaxID=1385935 RepID=UPI0003B9EBB7|nr:hypothetical protein [Leptolyngbya sp. Heron Island J]ESA32055.1 hypothetical protein N836_28280 [Leptolyngbya sp. Heron Island J]
MRKLEESVTEPWIVHVYGQNRKLLWVLEPSHGWLFLLGFGFGLLLTVIHVNLATSTSVSEALPTRDASESPALLQLD